MPAPISGILTPHMVPLDDRGGIAEAELRRYVNWLIERGVHGLYPNGSTGEFTRFSVEERRRIVSIVCDAAGGRVPVVAGAAEATVAETIRACEHCLEAGARAVAVVSPFYYRLSSESVYAYFCEIGRHSPIDDDIEDDDDDFEVDKDDTEEYDVDGTNKYHDYDSERTPSPPMCSCRTSSLLPFPPSLFPRRAGR